MAEPENPVNAKLKELIGDANARIRDQRSSRAESAHQDVRGAEKELEKIYEEQTKSLKEANELAKEQQKHSEQMAKLEEERLKAQEKLNKLNQKDTRNQEAHRKNIEKIEEKLKNTAEKRLDIEKKIGVINKKATESIQQGVKAYEDSLKKLTAIEKLEKSIADREKMAAGRQAANRAENLTKFGPLGQAAGAYSAAREGGAGKFGAVLSGAAAGASGAAGSAGASTLSNVLQSLSKGNWVGAIVDGLKGVAVASLDADDKLAKLSANYLKSTGKIPGTAKEAASAIHTLSGEFKKTYVGALDDLKQYGVSNERVYDAIGEISRTIQPSMADNGEALRKLTTDSFKFATLLDSTQEEVMSDMQVAFKNFGHGTTEVSEDIQSVYGILNAANKTVVAGVEGSTIRMRDFSRMVFESSRQADLWSFSYKNVSSILAAVGEQSKKAGLSIEQQNKVAKGFLQLAGVQGGRNETLEYLSGEETIKGVKKGLGLTHEQITSMKQEDLAKMLVDKGVVSEKSAAHVAEILKKAPDEAIAGRMINQQFGAEKVVQAGNLGALRTLLKAMDFEGQMNYMEKNFGQIDPGARQELLGMLTGEGKIEDIMKRRDELIKAGKEGGGGEGAAKSPAEVISAASNGLKVAIEELMRTEIELKSVNSMAGAATWALAKAYGANVGDKNPFEKNLALERNKGRSSGVKGSVERTGIDPTAPAPLNSMVDPQKYIGMTTEQLLLSLYDKNNGNIEATMKDFGKVSGVDDVEPYEDLLRTLVGERKSEQIRGQVESAGGADWKIGQAISGVPTKDAARELSSAFGVTVDDDMVRQYKKEAADYAENINRMHGEGNMTKAEYEAEQARRRAEGGGNVLETEGEFVDRFGEVWIRIKNADKLHANGAGNQAAAPTQ